MQLEQIVTTLAPWVIILPLIGLLVNLLLSKDMGGKIAGVVASIASCGSFVIALILMGALKDHPEAVRITLAEWMHAGTFRLDWALRVDTLSVTMMLVVSGVGTLIHIYATGYMMRDVVHNDDPGRYRRFFVYFNLFIAAMMILVSADNYLVLFVGWEGVGLCSYLLIGFWFEKGAGGIANAKAAKKAFVVNRIGDFGLIVALMMMFWAFGALDFNTIFEKAPEAAKYGPTFFIALTLFMLLGVAGKSAQLPLYLWLPDAMAGPTPVSALIHAATMVTAGVYLIVRSAPLFELAPVSQAVVMWVGALTALFAAGIAVTQYDIKKVLAYSTISQLGYMVAAVGMGAYVAGMFHLVTHAFFKALLFLAAGSVIQGVERGMEKAHSGGHGKESHSSMDPQDMRNMGGLQKPMKLTFQVYLMGALALSGIAPLAGFFSKDEILTAAKETSPIIFVILGLAAFLTAFYMGRQVFMIFFGKARTTEAEHATESPALVTTPLVILAVLSVFGGALNLPGVLTLEHWLEHTVESGVKVEFSLLVAGISLTIALAGIFLAWLIYGKRTLKASDPLEIAVPVLFKGLSNHWWLHDLHRLLIIEPYGKDAYGSLAKFMAEGFDLKFIDNISGGLGAFTRWVAGLLRRLQNGFVHTDVLAVVLGVILILGYLLTR